MAAVMNPRKATNFVLNRDNVTINSKEIIGTGHSSYVFKAIISKSDGSKEEIAAKKVRLNEQGEKNEIAVLKRLQHKNIITFYGTLPAVEDLDTYILMEIAQKGDLFHYLHKRDCTESVPVRLRWRWVVESARAIQYLHKEDLVHKDVKSPNFLIMADNTLKLGDFGFTREIHASHPTCGKGTERWMAPELLIEKIRSKKSDVYSYGVVVLEIQTEEVPFKDKDGLEVVIALYKGERLSIPDSCQPKIKYLLERCLEGDYKKRSTMDEVLDIIFNFDPEKYRSDPSANRQHEAGSMPSPLEQKRDLEEETVPLTSDMHNSSSENTRKPLKDVQQQQQQQEFEPFESEVEPWCKCKRCKPMPKAIEKICCNNVEQCLSLNPKIEEFLKHAQRYTPHKPDSDVNKYYSELRRKTYRLFVAWQYGKLGPNNRRVIPSCVVWEIRKYFPDNKNKYKGYIACNPKEDR